ncbi:metallophosphoesterase [Mucilaginibacter robiniae]|uniref:Metallophosphoesterase n=1 Tax=Mucilaginibacter robiniae TaxID=2728022 RepID=A0A7L5ECR4_9SPHI|nr:metallophosphoesterase [Mucilaginibacter robiniae]QJD98216.1 metallophosphoesterase [Mucilaginibacter robiniae]
MKQRIAYITLIWILTDLYFFQAVHTLSNNALIVYGYWLIDLILVGGIFYVSRGQRMRQHPRLVSVLMALMLLAVVPKIFGSTVLLLEDITRLFRGFPPRSYWVSLTTVVIAAIPFFALLFGLTQGRHHYQVLRETLEFDDLPDAFDGFTITQLSDIHSGSFTSEKGVGKGLALVNAQKSDIILFTGDLVNNKASEMDRWIPAFAKLQASYGKYSVLGNHDYGDYVQWENLGDKQANLNQLKKIHEEIGFNLLLNEATQIKKDGQAITLVGVENWGKGFHQYGDLKKATANVADSAFKILLSHDPTHWEAVTLKHHQPVHLTLAGHTHGMQFGIEFLGLKWSPAKYIYRNWAGLYKQNNQYLYVNRGFGFLGFKGRVGIWPEITVITLKKKHIK